TWAPHGQDPTVQRSIDLKLDWPNPAGTAEVALTLSPAGQPIHVDAELGSFASFLAGQVASVGATVRTNDARARFDGRASLKGDASGRITGEAQEMAGLFATLGLADPGLPQGAQGRLVGGADLTYTTDGRASLRDLTLSLGENTIKGAVDIVLSGARPVVTAQLNGGTLNGALLISESESGTGQEAGETTETGWPKARIDASGLATVDATIDLTFDALNTGELTLGPSKLKLSIDRSRAVLGLSPASVFGGTLNGQLVANNRNGLSVGGELSFSDIELSEALVFLADSDKLNGKTLGQVEFLGVGENMDAIMRSLSGTGWVEVGKGFFTGFDLEGLMRSGGGNGGSTVFDSLTASFTMRAGNLINPDLLMLLPRIRAEGAGRIGLGAQDLDYLFTPIAGNANAGRGLRIPVRIRGPWADPSIRPDLSRALDSELDAKKDEAEEQAKEKAREKLSEELGTEITPEQDLEDAVKDGLEKKVQDELLRLLGGD
ncbi:MAG: AsmA family protein, partial [Paracoccaceae bacterium]